MDRASPVGQISVGEPGQRGMGGDDVRVVVADTAWAAIYGEAARPDPIQQVTGVFAGSSP